MRIFREPLFCLPQNSKWLLWKQEVKYVYVSTWSAFLLSSWYFSQNRGLLGSPHLYFLLLILHHPHHSQPKHQIVIANLYSYIHSLLCARQYFKHLTCTLFCIILITALWDRNYYYPYFTDEKTKAQRWKKYFYFFNDNWHSVLC